MQLFDVIIKQHSPVLVDFKFADIKLFFLWIEFFFTSRRSPRSHSPKGRRDEDPYRHSHYHRKGDSHHSRQRNGEPEWVEQYRKKRAGREGSPNKRDMAEDQRRRYR